MLLVPPILAPSDADAIRAAYRLKDRLFTARDAKRLAATDLPTFHAIDPDGAKVSHEKVWAYIRWRFAHQTACRRVEKPLKILVKGDRAQVEVSLRDDYTVRTTSGALRREIVLAHGWSFWVRTRAGWRQAMLKNDRVSRVPTANGAMTRGPHSTA